MFNEAKEIYKLIASILLVSIFGVYIIGFVMIIDNMNNTNDVKMTDNLSYDELSTNNFITVDKNQIKEETLSTITDATEEPTTEIEEAKETLSTITDATEEPTTESTTEDISEIEETTVETIVEEPTTESTTEVDIAKNDNTSGIINISYTDYDIELLYRCVETETFDADFDSKTRVASVVINRVNDKRFPNTISSTITEPNQFAYSKTNISQSTIDAVNYVLENGDTANGALAFHSNSKTDTFYGYKYIFTDIVGHNFYK